MRTSESIDKIANAFRNAQAEMNAASKVATNPHFKSKYADLSTVIDAVKGPLNEARISFLQTVTADTTGIMVTTILMHETGQWFEETLYLPVPQQTPQAYGSAITYAKRYSLQSMCGLPSEDDDGEKGSQPEKADAHRVEVERDALRADAKARFAAVEESPQFKKPTPKEEPAPKPKRELSETERDLLRSHAKQMLKTFEAGGDIKTYYETQRFDDEQKEALWLYMAPAVRAALKPKIPPSDLASQP